MRNIKISLIISLIGILFFSVLNVYAQGLSDEASRYYDRGQRYYNQGKYKEAQQDFKKALTIISDSGQQGTPAQKEVQSGYQHAASYASEEQRKEIPPAPEKAVAAPQEAKPLEYTISIGDTLYITVWQEDLSAEVIVRPDGMISFPLVGDVRAGGLVISQLNAELTKRLQDYIKYPQVTVLLRKFGGKNYYKSTICYDITNYPLPGGGTDNCYTEGGKEYLSEMYCQNNGCQREDKHLCPNGCRDGACIK